MMLGVIVQTGKEVSLFKPEEAIKELLAAEGAICLYLEDAIVSFVRRPWTEMYTVVALERLEGAVARQDDVSRPLMETLVALAVDDSKPYNGVEKFFDDFGVRFVP